EGGWDSATAAAPASAACTASATVSAVVCAPQCARTGSGPETAFEIAVFRSERAKRMPSPVVPSSKTPSTPASLRNVRYGRSASSSSSLPRFRSGVSAAAIVLAIAPMLVPARGRASDLLDLNAHNVTLAVQG